MGIMAKLLENPCRTALVDALAILDAHGQHGAACYVAMAIDCLNEADQDAQSLTASTPGPQGLAAGGPA
jgi:hypothetical protein